MPKLVACMLYESYSQTSHETFNRVCSPYLIFVLNFDEVDYKALELNLQWLEAYDKRPERHPIKLTMMSAKDLTKR